MRECNNGKDDSELLDVAENIINERVERGKGRGFSPQALNERFGTETELENTDKKTKVLPFEEQVAKMQIVECIEERTIKQKNYINELERKLYVPDFEKSINQNLWKKNRDNLYSKHPRYPVIEDESSKDFTSNKEKLFDYLNLNYINNIDDYNVKIIEINKIIKKYGNLNSIQDDSYPQNPIGWIKSKVVT
jgi:hypothetical protein